MDANLASVSKFLSLVLRHKPETIGVSLDRGGWIAIDALINACTNSGYELSQSTLMQVVEQNDKSRFAIRDGLIRASQGHSIDVDLDLKPKTPPNFLFHGTAIRFLDSIRTEGLQSKERQFVHLSPDEKTAINVGNRHGKPVVLKINTLAMQKAGKVFYLSENGVWLTLDVPISFIVIPDIE